MKLSKTMADALGELFGPNPSKLIHVCTGTMRFKAFQELERIGLVRIRPAAHSSYETLREVSRTMDPDGKPLCEVLTR